jgi:hypothetical protein
MAGLKEDLHGNVVMALEPSSRVQNLAIGAASVASAAFLTVQQNTTGQDTGTTGVNPVGTSHVRLVSTVDCWVSFGVGAVASSTTSMFLPALSPEYFPVQQGDVVAVIQSATAGTLNIVECV